MDDTDRGWSEPALDTAVEITAGSGPAREGAAAAAAGAAATGAESAEDLPPDTVASRDLVPEQPLGMALEPPHSVVEPHAPTEPHPALIPSAGAVPAPVNPPPTDAAAAPTDAAVAPTDAAAAPTDAAAAPTNVPVPSADAAARSAELAAALLAAQAVVDALPSAAPKAEAVVTAKTALGASPTLVPRPATSTPYVSIPPPATVPSVGSMPGTPLAHSSLPPVVVTRARSGSPVAITEADLADELRATGLPSSLGRAKPGGAWLAVAGVVVLVAFGGGLALGRGTAPAPLPPVPVPAAVAVPTPEVHSTSSVPAASASEASPSPAGTSTTAAPAPSDAATAATSGPSLAAAVEAKLGAASKEGKEGGASTFNAKAATTNLELSAGRASKCHVAGDPAGPVTAAVTFGVNGRVSDVNVTTKGFSGTKTAQCIANKLRTTRAPSFKGSAETLNVSVTLRSAR